MDRKYILEAMYNVIKESTEWGVSEDIYGMFVDGVIAMTDEMLKGFELKETLKEKYITDKISSDELERLY